MDVLHFLPAVRARNGVEKGMIRRDRGGETVGEWGAEDSWVLIEGQREQQRDAHMCVWKGKWKDRCES